VKPLRKSRGHGAFFIIIMTIIMVGAAIGLGLTLRDLAYPVLKTTFNEQDGPPTLPPPELPPSDFNPR
jgi:hypothetical protein